MAQGYLLFGAIGRAINRAIGRVGWRMIAMLRSASAVPFSLGNDLFGLTAVCFWPSVPPSWLTPELASLQLPTNDLTTPLEGGSPWTERKFHSGS